ncbi:Hemin transport system permease protein HmuU [Methanoculleus chikugoensis]|jgi:iron complex transport system permease protein|uniref:Cobalamin import system permease protein BtuC n=1 Tax=Methanoculleus chikugoensis TaxID=118126 RepID=A0A1M4MNL4_9EURY|nr:iron chelate uptake ABC transporter family permease subunit [Methanoculleus chikugoensis]MDD4568164.1 iron chelate uptake ABC transporter family permease subunit [Methanoculleus chikugoensis]SCL76432.1 Hemin transport system permease protein HmuU [Methanoculleus chikugoensis]
MSLPRKTLMVIPILICALLASMVLAVAVGPTTIPLDTVLKTVLYKVIHAIAGPATIPLDTLLFTSANSQTIVWDVRLPRVIAAVLVGCALAVAGTTMQGLFRNPMADPYIIGTSSGGALGATLAIVLFSGTGRPVFAFVGAMAATFTVYFIARKGGKIPVETLLLSGVALATLLSAFLSFLMYTAGKSLHQIMFWLMGGFWNISWNDVIIVLPILAGCLVIYLFARDVNILSLGEEDATHLGVNVEQLKRILLALSSFLAGIAVSVAGSIGFIGLITPHVMRLIVGPDHRLLFPATALAGGTLLLWSDTLTRTFANDMPVGIITACFGAPFFIYLLRSRMKT